MNNKEETKEESEKEPEKKPDEGCIRYKKAIDRQPDSVIVVLRSHLLAEYYLDKIILAKLPRGDVIINKNLTFSQKITIVESLDFLSNYLLDSLKSLNTIRNNASHTLEYKVSEKDIDKIGIPFKNKYFELKSKYFNNIDSLLNVTLGLLLAVLDGWTLNLFKK